MARENPSLVDCAGEIFGDADYATVLEAGRLVAELSAHPGWVHVQAVLTAEAEKVARGMSRKPLEHTDYAFRHGRLGALRASADVPAAILAVASRREQAAREAAESAAQQEVANG